VIRPAHKYDIDKIIDLMKLFAVEYKSPLTANPMLWSKTHIQAIVLEIIVGRGFVLIDEENNGLLIACKTPVLWMPKMYQLQELMLRSDNKITTMRLIKEYLRRGKVMLQDKSIAQITLPTTSDIDLTKIGMIKVQTDWVMQ